MISKRNVRLTWIASALLGLTLAASLPSAAQASGMGMGTCIDTAPGFDPPSSLPLCANSGFTVNYFQYGSPATLGAENTYRLFNPNFPGGDPICALLYVFDPEQDMVACCSCLITASGGTGATVAALTFNPGGGMAPIDTGTVKVVSVVPTAECGFDQEANPASIVVPGGVIGWITHRPLLMNPEHTEVPFSDTREAPSDFPELANLCGGAGPGSCACPSETTGP